MARRKSATSAGPSTLKVLFIGNSFTARNDLPAMIASLAAAVGCKLKHQLVSAGGASLRRHWNKGDALREIQAGGYDYVVLQEQSTLPIKNASRMHENVRLFDQSIKATGAKTVLYMTWARRETPASQQAITQAYTSIGRELGAAVIPAGAAWELFIKAHDLPILHDKDGSHPTVAGTFLAACAALNILLNRPSAAVVASVEDVQHCSKRKVVEVMKNLKFQWLNAFVCIVLLFGAATEAAETGAATVRLAPVPEKATAEQIQAIIQREHNVYFPPGEFHIGTLRIDGWKNGVIFGAGRMTTKLIGRVFISGSSGLTISNVTIQDPSIKAGQAMIDVNGTVESKVALISVFASAGTLGYPNGKLGLQNGGTAIRMGAPGELIVQGVHVNGSDIGLSVEHPKAWVSVFGGNYQADRLHLRQLEGHLEVRAIGTQLAFGGNDIEINTPSPQGFHLVDGVRTEGSNGQRVDETLLHVPNSTAKVDVALRASCLGSLTRYANYNANGTLWLVANANYPEAPEPGPVACVTSRSPGKAQILSFGNKLGNSYDTAGPFDIAGEVSVTSTGDLWNLLSGASKQVEGMHYNEPLTADAMKKAGKAVPSRLSFTPEKGTAILPMPKVEKVKVAALPVISNLAELMLNVRDFGAIPGDGLDDAAAIQKAIEAALLPNGCSKPLYFPAGRYELSKPLFLDHLAGGGFWGDGSDKSILVSTSGQGVLRSDGAGYSTFVDLGFENAAKAESITFYMGLVNGHAKDKVKHPDTGASMQANMFYRTRFENGGRGLAVGSPGGTLNEDGTPGDAAGQMGDGFMIVDSDFRNIHNKGQGAAYASQNFNTLTNPIINSRFDDVDFAVINEAGSFNFYGNTLTRIATGGVYFRTVVSDGFVLSDITMDSSPVELVQTGHSSSGAHVIVENTKVEAAKAPPGRASQYAIGGTVVVIDSTFGGRLLSNGGGIGDNSLILDASLANSAELSGRGHGFFFTRESATPAK